MTHNIVDISEEEKWIDRFNKEFTVSHSGDSGIGGNDPQEPVYQICVDDPKEFISFIADILVSQRKTLEEKLLAKIDKDIACPDSSDGDCERCNVVREVKEIITSVFKEE